MLIQKQFNKKQFSQGSVTVLQKMTNYQEARVKLTTTQLNKLKFAAKNKVVNTLRTTKKNFQDEELDMYEIWVDMKLIDIKY